MKICNEELFIAFLLRSTHHSPCNRRRKGGALTLRPRPFRRNEGVFCPLIDQSSGQTLRASWGTSKATTTSRYRARKNSDHAVLLSCSPKHPDNYRLRSSLLLAVDKHGKSSKRKEKKERQDFRANWKRNWGNWISAPKFKEGTDSGSKNEQFLKIS